jgi:hypothetical protein
VGGKALAFQEAALLQLADLAKVVAGVNAANR